MTSNPISPDRPETPLVVGMNLSRPPRPLAALAALCLVAGAACTGAIDSGVNGRGGDGAGPERTGTGPGTDTLCGAAIDPGPRAPLRRLTRQEYDNRVRDLLGDDNHAADAFPADEDAGGFDLGATVSPLQFELYMFAAEGIAERTVTERLEAVLPCDPEVIGEDVCALELINTLGPRAYR